MDDGAFDRWVRLLGATGTRRTAIHALWAALLPGAASAEANDRKGDDGRDDGGAHGSGGQGVGHRGAGGRTATAAACLPSGAVCLTTGRRAKRCSNCCSGASTGRKKRKCACKPNESGCGSAAECCSDSCRGGTCRPPGPPALGDSCADDGDCASLDLAQCTNYHPDAGQPGRLFCLRQDGEQCATKFDCDGFVCELGTCRTAVDSGSVCISGWHVCRDPLAVCGLYDGEPEDTEVKHCLLPLGATCVDRVVESPCRTTSCSGVCCIPEGRPHDGQASTCCSGLSRNGTCIACLEILDDDQGNASHCCTRQSRPSDRKCCLPANYTPGFGAQDCCSLSVGRDGRCTEP